MSTKKIYLIRHGQTDYNLKGVVQGSGIDAPLNDTGRKQAEAFYQAYKSVSFDKVYTSVLQRSQQSVEKFLADGIPHEAFEGLNEISWGNREGISITPEEDAYYHHMLEEWRRGNTSLKIEGGESPEDLAAKQKPVLEYILKQEKEKTILICMHGRAMRILLTVLLNYPLKSMDTFEHSNLGLYELTYTGNMFTVDKFNDTSHFNGQLKI